jgi:CubicO group peptidase (beta-lactamase class C family)
MCPLVSKTALAAAALQLVGRGHFRLDERINSRPFTLRQFLQHSAGVPNYGHLASYQEAVRRGEKPRRTLPTRPLVHPDPADQS